MDQPIREVDLDTAAATRKVACWLDLAVFAPIWVVYALMVRRFWFITDDAYISFRYSKNLALGHGLIFNLGEPPVEGYSNFLWVLATAGFEYLGLSVEVWPLLLSAACGSVLLWLIFRTLRSRFEVGLPIAAVATLIWGTYPPVAAYSTSGLATMPFMLLMFVTFERLILRRGGMAPIAGGLAALGLALIRVEGLYWAIVIMIMAAVSRWMAGERVVKPLLIAFAILALGAGLHFLWRHSYYRDLAGNGLWLPNTASAKASDEGLSQARLERGLDYVSVQAFTQVTQFLVIPALFFIFRRKRLAIGLPIAAMAVAFHAYAILVSGDFMAMGRFLVPGWMFATLLFAWIFKDIAGARAGPAESGIALGLTAIGVGIAAIVVPRALAAADPFITQFGSGIGYGLFAGGAIAALLSAFSAVSRKREAHFGPALRGAAALGLAGAMFVMGIMPAFDLHVTSEAFRQKHHFRKNQEEDRYRSEYQQWAFQRDNAKVWCVRGRAMKRWCDPNARFVNGGIGATAYWSDLFIYDRNGLVTREVVERQVATDEHMRSPGHDRTVGIDFFLPKRPDIIRAAVVDSMAWARAGMSERMSRERFAGLLWTNWRLQLRRMFPGKPLDGLYVVDFQPVPEWEFGGPDQYLVYWRRIPDGEPPQQAWKALFDRLTQFVEGNDPNRAAMDTSKPSTERRVHRTEE
jgi:hypothetical protein